MSQKMTDDFEWVVVKETGVPLNTDNLEGMSGDDIIDNIDLWSINLKPLNEVDAEVETSVFQNDLVQYLRDCFRIGKKKSLELEFQKAGSIFRTTYWIFLTRIEGEEFYAMVVRDWPITEFSVLEKNWEITSGNEKKVVSLMPEQAAFFDLFDPES